MLGSGDAERVRQDFKFKIDTVSFIPSNAPVTGVAPDMDVAVDGVKWEFRDLGDPTAEDSRVLGHPAERRRHAAGPLPPPPADRHQ